MYRIVSATAKFYVVAWLVLCARKSFLGLETAPSAEPAADHGSLRRLAAPPLALRTERRSGPAYQRASEKEDGCAPGK